MGQQRLAVAGLANVAQDADTAIRREKRLKSCPRPCLTTGLTRSLAPARARSPEISESIFFAARYAFDGTAPSRDTIKTRDGAAATSGEDEKVALNSFLRIMAAGEDAPVLFGEDATQSGMGGVDVSNYLECSAFEVALETGQESVLGGSHATGHRVWRPARFVVRLGKSTPWLFEAARMNKRIDLTLYFFRRPTGREPIEQHFQYRIQQGRIGSIRLVQPDTLDRTTASLPERVELSVIPNVSEIESMTGSTLTVDDWAASGV